MATECVTDSIVLEDGLQNKPEAEMEISVSSNLRRKSKVNFVNNNSTVENSLKNAPEVEVDSSIPSNRRRKSSVSLDFYPRLAIES